jgi:stearoyl-CoA desaturase (Delta-9 desaturase)
MLTPLDSSSNSEPSTGVLDRQKIVVESNYLQKLQRRFALVTVLIPFLGSVFAIGLLWLSDIGVVEVGLLATMYMMSIIGIELGFHRYFSHSAFCTTTPVRVILAILGCMAAQGPIIYWVSHHRSHHQYSDRSGDPHSPHFYKGEHQSLLRGLFHAQLGWLFDSKHSNSALYAKDLLRDNTITKVNHLYPLWVVLGLAIPTILGGIFTWSWFGAIEGFLWGGLVRVFLAHQVTWSINSICHIFGDRPFNTNDHSRNNVWLVLPSLGGAWHNNHHAFPNTAINAFEWWQIDLCGYVVFVLEKLGLAWNVKKPTNEMLESKKVTHPT